MHVTGGVMFAYDQRLGRGEGVVTYDCHGKAAAGAEDDLVSNPAPRGRVNEEKAEQPAADGVEDSPKDQERGIVACPLNCTGRIRTGSQLAAAPRYLPTLRR